MGALKYFSFCLILAVTRFCFALAEPELHNGSDGTKFYIEIENKYNWFQAQHECARRDLQLVEVQTGQKHNIFLGALNSYFGKSHNLWIGANDEYNGARDYNRPFYWTTSGKRMTFSYWSEGNPDNFRNNEHCVHTWTERGNFNWNDAPCTEKMGYVCERKSTP